tara:strand:- start:2298 stop:2597 length:300 start_codon:yes stop_codon:yes gene_type:complete
MLELPPDFIHDPPKNYTYEVKEFKRNVLGIWCCNHTQFVFNDGAISKTIWGFYNVKKQCYYAPINSRKQGSEIDIRKTTPYTAMQIVKPMRPTISNFYE